MGKTGQLAAKGADSVWIGKLEALSGCMMRMSGSMCDGASWWAREVLSKLAKSLDACLALRGAQGAKVNDDVWGLPVPSEVGSGEKGSRLR